MGILYATILNVSCDDGDLDTSGVAYKYKPCWQLKALNEVFPSKQGRQQPWGSISLSAFFVCKLCLKIVQRRIAARSRLIEGGERPTV